MIYEQAGTTFSGSSGPQKSIFGERGATPYRPFSRADGRGRGNEGGRSTEGGRGRDTGGSGSGSGGSGGAAQGGGSASALEAAASTPYGQVIPPSGGTRQTLAIEPPTTYTIPTWGYVALGLGAVFVLYRLIR
jgi:hypothetical protein